MKEIAVSSAQVVDSIGLLDEAVRLTFSEAEVDSGYWQPEEFKVPRPTFGLLEPALDKLVAEGAVQLSAQTDNSTGKKEMRYIVGSSYSQILGNFPGLRGFATGRVQTKSGAETITGPAIVLEDGRSISMLTAEPDSVLLSDMQHQLLDVEYVKYHSEVSSTHEKRGDVPNAGDIGPALVIASNIDPSKAHSDVHSLALGTDIQKGIRTFAPNFSAAKRQDIKVGEDTRAPRSCIFPLNNVLMYVGRVDQLPADVSLLGLDITDNEMAVALTLAGTISRGVKPNLQANLSVMVGE